MAIEAGDFRNGLTLMIDGNLYQVLEFQHVKPGKGAALLKTKMKNLKTGGIMERSFNATTKFEQAMIDKRVLQYSYNANNVYYFMDTESFEMYELDDNIIGFAKNFLTEGIEVNAKFFETEIIDIEIPEKLELKVVETSDAVAGNTSSTATKDAVVETGLVVKVPLFIKLDDVIVVNTNDGKYCGRA